MVETILAAAVTHVVLIFPKGQYCLRLVRALAAGTHENWPEQHRYLKMDDLREHKETVLRAACPRPGEGMVLPIEQRGDCS